MVARGLDALHGGHVLLALRLRELRLVARAVGGRRVTRGAQLLGEGVALAVQALRLRRRRRRRLRRLLLVVAYRPRRGHPLPCCPTPPPRFVTSISALISPGALPRART